MKNIVVLVFCMVTANGFGQTPVAPLYYLNNDVIDIENVYVNPANQQM